VEEKEMSLLVGFLLGFLLYLLDIVFREMTGDGEMPDL